MYRSALDLMALAWEHALQRSPSIRVVDHAPKQRTQTSLYVENLTPVWLLSLKFVQLKCSYGWFLLIWKLFSARQLKKRWDLETERFSFRSWNIYRKNGLKVRHFYWNIFMILLQETRIIFRYTGFLNLFSCWSISEQCWLARCSQFFRQDVNLVSHMSCTINNYRLLSVFVFFEHLWYFLFYSVFSVIFKTWTASVWDVATSFRQDFDLVSHMSCTINNYRLLHALCFKSNT